MAASLEPWTADLTPALTALVTGATSGIGLACAEALLQAGRTRLVIVGRNETRGQTARGALIKIAPTAACLPNIC